MLALCVCAAAPLSAQSRTGAPVQSTDDYNQSQFWIGNFPEGQYVVHLSRIVAVAQHRYILDNACMVHEVTLITMGNTPTKFYYLETLGQGSGINAIKNVTERAKELGSGAVNRRGHRPGYDRRQGVSEYEYGRVPRGYAGTAQQDVRLPPESVAGRKGEDFQAVKVERKTEY